jgi:hypothetical protein
MFNSNLTQAVDQFAHLTHGLAEAELEQPWAWGDYKGEGVRFAFFRVLEELRTLAVRLAQQHRTPTSAQRILAHYHIAYRDLYAALLGVSAELAEQPPAEKQWPARLALAHMVGADVGFYGVITYALNQHRSGIWQPTKIPNEAWEPMIGLPEADLDALLEGPLEGLLAYHHELHARVLREFAAITEDEIEKPSMYWESQPMTIRFRLHRFESHLRQHTIQVDKTLVAIGHAPTEACRLLRLIYTALAEVEGAQLGADQAGAKCEPTAQTILTLTADIRSALNSTR